MFPAGGEDVNLAAEINRFFTYYNGPRGQKLWAVKEREPQEVQEVWQEIQNRMQRGEDYTDLVLDRLLPHADFKNVRESGRRVSTWPCVTRDVRSWFENARWAEPGDWPAKARWFVEAVEIGLTGDWDRFGEHLKQPEGKGFRAGFITPVLHCLKPELPPQNSTSEWGLAFLLRYWGEPVPDMSTYPAFLAVHARVLQRVQREFPALDLSTLDSFFYWARHKSLGNLAALDDEAAAPASSPPPADPVPPEQRVAWIFQANPKIFDIDGFLQQRPRQVHWRAGRHAGTLARGNRVAVYRRGKVPAVVALGELATDPASLQVGSEESRFNRAVSDDEGLRVVMTITHNLVDRPLLKEEVETTPGLENLVVFRVQQGMAYRLSDEEWAALCRLADQRQAELDRDRQGLDIEGTPPPRRFWLVHPPGDVEGAEEALARGRLSLAAFPSAAVGPAAGDVVLLVSEAGLHAAGTVPARQDGDPDDPEVSGEASADDSGIASVKVRWWTALWPRKAVAMPDWPDDESGAGPGWWEIKPDETRSGLLHLATAVSYADPRLIRDLVTLARTRKQMILDGPPGTSKTWLARLVAGIIALDDPVEGDRTRLVQFHPSYAYEDFVIGLRPRTDEDGHGSEFEWTEGHLLQLCKVANENPRAPCVLVVDEINRGNLPRIFGELLFALEYRDQVVRLASGESFRCPQNLVLIGTMNTADRSIALVDHALRRRFAFWRCEPDPDILRRWLRDYPPTDLDAGRLVEGLTWLNHEVRRQFGSSLMVGHSYLMKKAGTGFGPSRELLRLILCTEIVPLLEEYGLDFGGATDGITYADLCARFGVDDAATTDTGQ